MMITAILSLALLTGGVQTGTPQDSLAEAQHDLQQGRNAEAIALLEKAAAADPNAKGVAHALGLAYYRTGKLVPAQKQFAQAIAQNPEDKESVQMEGLTLYRLGQPAAAIPYLERVKQWMPGADADAAHVLGLCYLNAQRFDEARKAFADQYGISAESGGAHLLLAQMMLQANLPEQGAVEAGKALHETPGLPLAHFVIGEVALFKSDPETARKEFEAERALNPADAEVYERLGDVYTRTGDYEKAQAFLMRSLSLDSSRTGPFLLLGKVFLRTGDTQGAMLYLKHAVQMDPSNFIAHTLLGQAYRNSGHPDLAQQEFETARKIHASSELKLEPVK